MTPLDDGALDRLQEVACTDTVSHPRYQIGPLIATGGMGSVYQARDLLLDRDIAIKVLRGLDHSPGLADRLDQEARILARPNRTTRHVLCKLSHEWRRKCSCEYYR